MTQVLVSQLQQENAQREQNSQGRRGGRRNASFNTEQRPSLRRNDTERTDASTIEALVEVVQGYNSIMGRYHSNMEHIISLFETAATATAATATRNPPARTQREEPWVPQRSRSGQDDSRHSNTFYRGNSHVPSEPERDAYTTSIETPPEPALPDLSPPSRQRTNNPPSGIGSDWYRSLLSNDYSYFINTYPLYTMADNTMSSENRAEGLTPEQIAQSTVELTFSMEDASQNQMSNVCPISLEDFSEGETILQIRECRHVFKPAQLRRWFERHNCCPVCRRNLQNRPSAAAAESDIPDLEEESDVVPPAVPDFPITTRNLRSRMSERTSSDRRNGSANTFSYIVEFPLYISDLSGSRPTTLQR